MLLGAAAGAGGEAADDFNIPGTESQQALDLFKKHSPAFAGADSTLVFSVKQGKISDPAPRAAVTGALDKVRDLKGVQVVEDPFAKGGTLSRDGRLASVAVRYSTEPQDLKKPDGEALVKAAESGERSGVSVAERGILIDLASEQTAPVGELIGVAIAIILLTLLFRSLAAMAVTLAGALIGVVVGQILLAALAAPLDLPAFATVIAVMLGLGAGIDYSLLDHRPRARADGGRRQPARRVGQGRRHGWVLGRRGRPDRDGGDRGPARDRDPADRQARHRGGARRRRRSSCRR